MSSKWKKGTEISFGMYSKDFPSKTTSNPPNGDLTNFKVFSQKQDCSIGFINIVNYASSLTLGQNVLYHHKIGYRWQFHILMMQIYSASKYKTKIIICTFKTVRYSKIFFNSVAVHSIVQMFVWLVKDEFELSHY